ncbi:MAG: transposase [Clostridia bacterium]
MGKIPISVPQDRNSDFDPQIVPKYKRDISEIEGKVINMYARGLSVRKILDRVRDIDTFDVRKGMVTAITNKPLPEIEAWQKSPLAAVNPIVFMDAIVFNVRDNNVIRKTEAHVILGINEEGNKEVLSITIGENERAKFRLTVLNELKNHGVRDIFVLCAKETGCIVTAENHNIIGGLGSAVSEALCENFPVPLMRVGIQDRCGEVGEQDYLAKTLGIIAPNIVSACKKVLARKRI